MKTKRFDINIIPRMIFYENKQFAILKVIEESFIIRHIDILLDEEDIIKKVLIGKKHHPNGIDTNHIAKPPNEPSEETEWCLPVDIKGQKYEPDLVKKIVKLMRMWNYNSCYWKTWDSDWIVFKENVDMPLNIKIPKSVKNYIIKEEPTNVDMVRLRLRYLLVSMVDGIFKTGEEFLKYLRKSKTRL